MGPVPVASALAAGTMDAVTSGFLCSGCRRRARPTWWEPRGPAGPLCRPHRGCFRVGFWAWPPHCCSGDSFQTAQGRCPPSEGREGGVGEELAPHSVSQPRGGGSGPGGARSFASGDWCTVAACLASGQRPSPGHLPCVHRPADPFSGTSSSRALSIPVRCVLWGPFVSFSPAKRRRPAPWPVRLSWLQHRPVNPKGCRFGPQFGRVSRGGGNGAMFLSLSSPLAMSSENKNVLG